MTTKRFLSLFIALAVAIGAVSLGTAVAASPGHHHDDHKPAAKEAAKTKKTRQAAAQQAAAGETVAGLAFGTLEAPRDIAITMTDTLRFEPGTIVVGKGETIRFVLDNPTAAPHDFTLGDLDAQLHHREEMAAGGGHSHAADAAAGGLPGPVSLDPGASTEVVATFDEAGELLVGCHVPGHWEAGMQGAVTVVDLEDFVVGTEAMPRDIPVVMTDDLRFDPEMIVVTAGETVRFKLDNPTAAPHDFTIGDADAQAHHAEEMAAGMTHDHHDASAAEALPGAVAIGAGQSVEVVATFEEAGERELLIGCHVPGHWEAGMRGRIVILPALA